MSSELSNNDSSTILQYSVNPNEVIIATKNDFTLVMMNPDTGSPIQFMPGPSGDQIQIVIPAPPNQTGAAALTDNIDFTAQSLTAGFIAGQQSAGSSTFIVQPIGQQQLLPGQAIQVQFQAVTVNSTPSTSQSTPQIEITEFIDDGDDTINLPVQKLPQQPHIIGWLDPWVLGQGAQSTLYWQSYGGTSVDVIGFAGDPATKNFPVQGDPPYPGKTQVTVPPTEAQRTYTLRLNGKSQQTTPVTLTQHKPAITVFQSTPDQKMPVGATDTVKIIWHTLYTLYAYLQTPTGNTRVAPDLSGPKCYKPGLDAYKSRADDDHIPGFATYTLQAAGYSTPATSSITFRINPIKVLYFKYAQVDNQGKFSGLTYQVDPGDWPGVKLSAGNVNQLSVYQPGAPTTTLWLGEGDTVHPQVKFFNATTGQGRSFNLQWYTANLKSLTLVWLDANSQKQSYQVPNGQIEKGTYTVTPTKDTDYTLEATGKNGETINSILRVKASS